MLYDRGALRRALRDLRKRLRREGRVPAALVERLAAQVERSC